jgi:hypothetical protein
MVVSFRVEGTRPKERGRAAPPVRRGPTQSPPFDPIAERYGLQTAHGPALMRVLFFRLVLLSIASCYGRQTPPHGPDLMLVFTFMASLLSIAQRDG